MTDNNITTAPDNSLKEAPQLFSMKRFISCFKFYIATHRKELMLTFLGFLLLPTLCDLIMTWANVATYNYIKTFRASFSEDPLLIKELSIFMILMIFGAAAMGSWSFADISNKHQLMRMFEIPASMFEKFLVRFIIAIPCFVILFIAGTMLGDLVRVLVLKCFTPFGDYTEFLSLKELITLGCDYVTNESSKNEIAIFYMGVLLSGSFFSFGAILFRKHTFIKTGVTLFLLMMGLSYIIYFSMILFFDDTSSFGISEEIISSPAIIIQEIIFTIFFYGLTYLRLKETEIINRW